MVMCSKCHKRVAVVFVTRIENGNKVSEGLCIKCAKDMGVPVDNMLGNVMDKFGITPEQLENMENEVNEMLEGGELPAFNDNEGAEDGGAPAIDFPQIFGEAGSPAPAGNQKGSSSEKGKKKDDGKQKKNKYLKHALLTPIHDKYPYAQNGITAMIASMGSGKTYTYLKLMKQQEVLFDDAFYELIVICSTSNKFDATVNAFKGYRSV